VGGGGGGGGGGQKSSESFNLEKPELKAGLMRVPFL